MPQGATFSESECKAQTLKFLLSYDTDLILLFILCSEQVGELGHTFKDVLLLRLF